MRHGGIWALPFASLPATLPYGARLGLVVGIGDMALGRLGALAAGWVVLAVRRRSV
jgi:hypothetical protein